MQRRFFLHSRSQSRFIQGVEGLLGAGLLPLQRAAHPRFCKPVSAGSSLKKAPIFVIFAWIASDCDVVPFECISDAVTGALMGSSL